ncbi:DUF1800 family protein [Agrobacterium vitis]|uniref:DUF1800 family protein n=1 Tax=Agrobacterium vitis TaxID=373 RepID=A0ABD6GE67_AGRVI|nr:DUF1800 family protein [Agrobacterium vitis]MUO80720.1 DUF1800 family protein [Agrobacterium vitis]MUO96426.1 DUF1800 family protein [Agrobacterium vitis]MUP07191.1 DUF1800 family protein [Agrobacterium vitis]MUZ82076.1 DUF1800 family protein [Agrobacterium vitis]MVA09808.1 DUF1800 family protein [Agrobacterium vitis]
MSNSNDVDAALALWRFGLGAADGGITAIKDAPRDLLKEEITERAVPTPVGAQLRSSSDLLVALYDYQKQVKAERDKQPAAGAMAGAAMAGANAMQGAGGTSQAAGMQGNAMQAGAMPPQSMDKKPDMPVSKRPYFPQQILLAEADARFNGTIHQPLIGFGERLAMFWANHFSVAISKGGEVHILAGAFEREAIRPHVFGRFEDMLLAVETHPAMLVFLDNQQSIGPTSPANKNGKRGLNENLAREIMELHTLGVDGGYSQADVTSLARIITGWTFYRDEKRPGPQGKFIFNANAHEPGDHTVMGMTYAEGNVEQGRTALRDLARHPATARHIAMKLVRYFVADQPPPALVTKLAAAYTKSQGDLSAVYTALVEADEAWNPTLTKMRMPQDYVAAMLRTSGIRPKPEQIISMLNALGQPLWNPAGPNGFSDVTDAWASSESLATRIDAANLFAHQIQGQIDPRAFAGDRLGPLLTADTLQAISRAETRPQGLSIAFLSPEFQRR